MSHAGDKPEPIDTVRQQEQRLTLIGHGGLFRYRAQLRARAGRTGDLGVAALPAAVERDAGAPASTDRRDDPLTCFWPDGLPDGYRLEPADEGWWLVHECGNYVDVGRSSELRLRLRIGQHRCGPPNSAWHDGPPKHRRRSWGSARLTQLAERRRARRRDVRGAEERA